MALFFFIGKVRLSLIYSTRTKQGWFFKKHMYSKSYVIVIDWNTFV